MENKRTLRILAITDDDGLKNILCSSLDDQGYKISFEEFLGTDIGGIISSSPDMVVMDLASSTREKMEMCEALKKDFATAHIPIITLISRKNLQQQLLSMSLGVDDYLVKPPDSIELRVRVEMALKRAQHSFYASPLTGLPGGMVIEDTLKEKIKSNIPFVVGHVDIDNFKSFNDKYGYLKGDRVIMQTAYMLSTSIRNLGNKTDFLGHIGGDDFVVVTTPEKYNEICQNFICMFDTIAPFQYNSKDRKNGYIEAKDRMHRLNRIPVMSVTIALVMKNTQAEVASIIELNERISEVKQYLKKIPGSKYLADRRVAKKNDYLQVKVFSNDESVVDSYKPLGQILLEKKVITLEQLDKALKMHWKSGLFLGEVLKDLGYISEQKLSKALAQQETSLGSVK